MKELSASAQLAKKKTPGATVGAYIYFIIISIICIVPLILLAIASFTETGTLTRDGYTFFPAEMSLDAYKFLFLQSDSIIHSLLVSVVLTVVGTTLGLLMTTLLAYPLSRAELKGGRLIMFFVFFTLLFNGGMVATYFMYSNILNMKNTYWALLIPMLLLNGFNVLLVRTYFAKNIPASLIEAARIDGAGEVRTFFQIVVPISTPILATIGMLIGISYWNDWYNGLLFSTKPEYFSLQNFLYKIMMDLKFLAANSNTTSQASSLIAKVPSNTVRMAMAFIGAVPIMVRFPIMQRFFARGLTLGSVKE
jgi:putative aldouronate transport system permease protein